MQPPNDSLRQHPAFIQFWLANGSSSFGFQMLSVAVGWQIINVPSVASVRERTGLSQLRFAQLLGVSVRTLQEWEQGRRAPSGAARTLLLIAQKNPGALLEVA